LKFLKFANEIRNMSFCLHSFKRKSNLLRRFSINKYIILEIIIMKYSAYITLDSTLMAVGKAHLYLLVYNL